MKTEPTALAAGDSVTLNHPISIGQRISVAFGGSESRQDFRNRGTAETLGDFCYACNSLAVFKARG